MENKITVGILCGGRSAEHEVSLQSAKSVVEAINRHMYDVILIGLDKTGKWHTYDSLDFLENPDDPSRISLRPSESRIALVPGGNEQKLLDLSSNREIGPIDVFFPVLHGTFGEDGTIQGLFEMIDVPFVGAGVLSSAVGMDKDVTKRLLSDAGLPTAKCLIMTNATRKSMLFSHAKEALGLPFFVKPANLGSSVGVGKVTKGEEFDAAIDTAFEYDRKILLEQYIPGREIECSVLGNEDPIASLPGEVVPDSERYGFYSYDAKYIDGNGAVLKIPADLPQDTVDRVQLLAIQAFKALCCEGMARADFFLSDDYGIVINELNLIPGFTKISMYPKLWECSGIPYPELIDRLIRLAMERYKRERSVQISIFR